MDKDLEGIRRPVYRNLWIYWLMMLLGTVLGQSDSTLISVIAFIPVIIELYQLYLMRTVSDGLEQAFRWNIAGMTIAVASLVLALLALGSALAVLLVLAALGGVIVTVIADYYFYSALDELVLLAVPHRRGCSRDIGFDGAGDRDAGQPGGAGRDPGSAVAVSAGGPER